MPGTVRCVCSVSVISPFLAAFSMAVAILATGCTSTLTVDVDEHEDFSDYRTWDWMPHIRSRVQTPQSNQPALDIQLADLIRESLESRGFEHAPAPADFYVTYHLSIQPKSELVEQPMAAYLLSSHNSSASYWVEGTESVERRFDDFRLAVAITRGGSHMSWQASIEKKLEPTDSLPLESAVEKLFDRLPDLGGSADSTRNH